MDKNILSKYEYSESQKAFLVDPTMIESFVKPEGFEEWEIVGWERTEYYEQRILKDQELTEKENIVKLFGGKGLHDNEISENKIFTCNLHGDIEILLYSLKRKPFIYAKDPDSVNSTKSREKYAVLTRYAPHREERIGNKYSFDTSKTGNHLMWHPFLLDLYDKQEEVETLVLTEGYIKAFSAAQKGIVCVGLPSITTYTNKKGADEIHPEIQDFISTCKVKNVVILWDGDCRDVSMKSIEENKDLYRRAGNFARCAINLRKLIRKQFATKRLDIWFGRVKTDELAKNPKGIDDLIQTLSKDGLEQLIRECHIMDSPAYYIRKINISSDSSVKAIYQDFKIDKVDKFYAFHSLKIGEKDFVFDRNTYTIENGEVRMLIPANVKDYKRIGTDYYRLQKKPFPSGKKDDVIYEMSLDPWLKGTIVDDHGAKVVNHIEKFRGFTNMPSHTNYQQVVDGYWNLYQDIDHEIVKGEWDHIKGFMMHIFGEQLELGYDYIKLLYEEPMQKVPVLCLVSRKQETGKSTFVHLLKLLFKSNMAIISNEELENNFNSSWIDKKIVACEETVLEKRATYEKIKSLSTAKSSMRNEKNKSASDIPCIISFLFCSNEEDNFLKMGDEDRRFWVIKVGAFTNWIENFDEKLESELSAFLEFIMSREYSTKRSNRMYFDHSLIRTSAFDNVVQNSRSGVEKEMRASLEAIFIDFDLQEIMMTAEDIREQFGLKRYEKNYVEKVLTQKLGVSKLKNEKGVGVVTRYTIYKMSPFSSDIETVKRHGRPFVFKREDFVTDSIEISPEAKQNIKSTKDKNSGQSSASFPGS